MTRRVARTLTLTPTLGPASCFLVETWRGSGVQLDGEGWCIVRVSGCLWLAPREANQCQAAFLRACPPPPLTASSTPAPSPLTPVPSARPLRPQAGMWVFGLFVVAMMVAARSKRPAESVADYVQVGAVVSRALGDSWTPYATVMSQVQPLRVGPSTQQPAEISDLRGFGLNLRAYVEAGAVALRQTLGGWPFPVRPHLAVRRDSEHSPCASHLLRRLWEISCNPSHQTRPHINKLSPQLPPSLTKGHIIRLAPAEPHLCIYSPTQPHPFVLPPHRPTRLPRPRFCSHHQRQYNLLHLI